MKYLWIIWPKNQQNQRNKSKDHRDQTVDPHIRITVNKMKSTWENSNW